MVKRKIRIKHVAFTPEEMAYDPTPEETRDWVFVGRGPEAMFLRPSDSRIARLDPDVAVFFRDDKTVNEVLRRAKGLMKISPANKRRKSA